MGTLQGGQPVRIRPTLRQQAATLHHRAVMGGQFTRVAGFQRQHQPVQKPAATACPVLKQAVHLRCQPDGGKIFAHRIAVALGLSIHAKCTPFRPQRIGPVAIWTVRASSPHCAITSAATPHSVAPCRGSSSMRAPRRPRPGTSSETASSRLVLPLPFGPVMTVAGHAGFHER